MKYTKLTIEIPAGYEREIMRTVTNKVESIISREFLRPTDKQKKDFENTFEEAKQKLNNIENNGIIVYNK